MQRSTEHILTTHTGSLPRPAQLAAALQSRDRGENGGDLSASIRDAVADVVQRQVAAGIDVVNDGEAGKFGYATYVKERLDGFGGEGALPAPPLEFGDFPEYMQAVMGGLDFAMPTCDGPVAYRDLGAVRTDIANLTDAVDGSRAAQAFMTAASPGVIALFLQNRCYSSHEEYITALAEAMKTEYDEIHRAGLLLQLDAPDLTAIHLAEGAELGAFRRRVGLHIEAINHATRDIPEQDMRLHLCWGNYEGPHHHDVALGDILDIVLQARPAALSFEGANPRHAHEWQVFADRRLPDGKVLIPGVIDTTTNFIEHPELVAQRVSRYAELVGRENVIAGTDCGFATFANFITVHPQIAWAKLAALAEGARMASERLWARPASAGAAR